MNSIASKPASPAAKKTVRRKKKNQPGKSERTRAIIMKTAERMFGEKGIDAVGLRAISEAANQKNNNAVQYHFGSKLGLLSAILEHREAQLQPLRQHMLDLAEKHGRLNDLRWLLRICFEPNFKLYRDDGDIAYIKLHATYLSTHRPRGFKHPVDYESPNSVAYRQTLDLLIKRLSFIGERRTWLRLESAGSMFLNALIQHSARADDEKWITVDELFEDCVEMMAAAMSAPPMDNK